MLRCDLHLLTSHTFEWIWDVILTIALNVDYFSKNCYTVFLGGMHGIPIPLRFLCQSIVLDVGFIVFHENFDTKNKCPTSP